MLTELNEQHVVIFNVLLLFNGIYDLPFALAIHV